MRKIRAHSERRFFHYKNLELSEHTKADGKEHIFEYRPLLNYSNGSDGTAPESNDARPFVRGSIDADVRNPILIFNVFQVLQSPLSGEKKCEHFSSRPKKEHLAEREEDAQISAPASETRHPGVRLWRPGGYLRFTLGLPSASPLLTLG